VRHGVTIRYNIFIFLPHFICLARQRGLRAWSFCCECLHDESEACLLERVQEVSKSSLQSQRGLALPASVPLTHTPSLRSNHRRKRPTASPSIYSLRLRLRTSPVTIHSLQLCIGVAVSLQTLSTPRGALRLSFAASSSTATYLICSSTTLPCLLATQAHYPAVAPQSRPEANPVTQ